MPRVERGGEDEEKKWLDDSTLWMNSLMIISRMESGIECSKVWVNGTASKMIPGSSPKEQNGIS